MKTFIISNTKFFAIKHILNQTVFWKRHDKDNVKVKPVFTYARKILEQL